MKKHVALFTLLAFLTIPMQGAFAWEYDGLGSLNPFTNFGRNDKCCQKVVKVKCKERKLTKCEKLNGVKLQQEQVTGCAAPIIQEVDMYDYNTNTTCPNCHRAF